MHEDGTIFVSIDDVEVATLRLLLDEIFGTANFLANFVWQSKDTPGNNSSVIAETHNHILGYAKSSLFIPNLLVRNEKQIANYKNPENDLRGNWLAAPLTRGEHRERDYYPLKNLAGTDVFPPSGTCWRRPKDVLKSLIAGDRIWWGRDGKSTFPMENNFYQRQKMEL